MKVFLSSTYLDLVEYRKKAAEALARLRQEAGWMEIFGARPEEPQEASLNEVETSDIFVGIYAHRYGHIPAKSKISITEAEFRHAKKLKKPMFCFVLDEAHPWLPKMIENEPGRSKLVHLKAKIGADLVRETFTTPDDLALKIATSVGNYLASLDPVTGGLGGLLAQVKDSPKEKQLAAKQDLAAVVKVAFETFEYVADERRSGKRDEERERLLSRGWRDAGMELATLGGPAAGLAERYFLKAQYWLEPETWSQERIAAAKIRLEDVAKKSRAVLSAMSSGTQRKIGGSKHKSVTTKGLAKARRRNPERAGVTKRWHSMFGC